MFSMCCVFVMDQPILVMFFFVYSLLRLYINLAISLNTRSYYPTHNPQMILHTQLLIHHLKMKEWTCEKQVCVMWSRSQCFILPGDNTPDQSALQLGHEAAAWTSPTTTLCSTHTCTHGHTHFRERLAMLLPYRG